MKGDDVRERVATLLFNELLRADRWASGEYAAGMSTQELEAESYRLADAAIAELRGRGAGPVAGEGDGEPVAWMVRAADVLGEGAPGFWLSEEYAVRDYEAKQSHGWQVTMTPLYAHPSVSAGERRIEGDER